MAPIRTIQSDVEAQSTTTTINTTIKDVRNRQCPGIRTWWTVTWDSYSLRTSDKTVLARRIAMWLILGLLTAKDVLILIAQIYLIHILDAVLHGILAIIWFFFTASCLCRIEAFSGHRRVFGKLVGRLQYDLLLFGVALGYVGLLVGALFGFTSAGSWSLSVILGLLIFGAAWVSSWDPEEPEESQGYGRV